MVNSTIPVGSPEVPNVDPSLSRAELDELIGLPDLLLEVRATVADTEVLADAIPSTQFDLEAALEQTPMVDN